MPRLKTKEQRALDAASRYRRDGLPKNATRSKLDDVNPFTADGRLKTEAQRRLDDLSAFTKGEGE